MKKAMNNVVNLYLLEDATTNIIVTAKTSVEAIVEAFYSYMSENQGVSCCFYKLVCGNMLKLEDNELPEEFLYEYDDECDEEYGDCAYCLVCTHQW